MLKNKIYKYFLREFLKNFITTLFIFTAVAWTVKAVNFLDLMVEDGFPAIIYFKYSLLNLSSIAARFVPLSFLLSLIITIIKFERQQEFLILWTIGLNKTKIFNIFFLISFIITLLQIILSLFINPFLLNKSRYLLKENEIKQISSLLKSNDFSDSFKGVTFYIGKKKNNELNDIFIKDTTGSISTISNEADTTKDTTIIAKKGFIANNKLILFNGIIQTLNEKNEIKNISFEKTELSVDKFSTRTILQPKIQETSSYDLLKCFSANKSKKLNNCTFKNNSEAREALSKRLITPLYIPLISVIASFLLIYQKENKYNYLRKYIIFLAGFSVLVFSEMFLKFTGYSRINTIIYFFTPLFLFIITFFVLIKKMISSKIKI
jgi:lipopolysaccharide export system permease protein